MSQKWKCHLFVICAGIFALVICPIFFAEYLFSNLKSICVESMEKEASVLAAEIAASPHEHVHVCAASPIESLLSQGYFLCLWKNSPFPIRYGNFDGAPSFEEPPPENKTFFYREPISRRRYLCVSRNAGPHSVLLLCRDERLVFQKINTMRMLLIGMGCVILPGILLLLNLMAEKIRSGSEQDTVALFRQAVSGPLPKKGDISNEKFGDLLKEIRQMRQNIVTDKSGGMEDVAALASGIAHDFGNLLTVFRGNLELAGMMQSTQECGKYLEQCGKALKAASRLNNEFLSFAKGGAPIREAVPAVSFLHECAMFVLRGTGVQVEFINKEPLPDMLIDPAQMEQVFQNLFLNALQAMKRKGYVRIILARSDISADNFLNLDAGLYLRCQISDTGPGIPPENREKVFRPFFTTRRDGTGMGLSMCFSTVKRHSGSIRVIDSPYGQGACIELLLPAVEAKSGRKTDESCEPAFPPVRYTGGGRVLILDDQEPIRLLLGQILTLMKCDCDYAATGSECIEKYRTEAKNGNPFDVLFLDLTLPNGPGGKEVLEILRKDYGDVKAVAASGYCDDPVLAGFVSFGFAERLKKPFRVKDVDRVMRHVMHDVAAASSPCPPKIPSSNGE